MKKEEIIKKTVFKIAKVNSEAEALAKRFIQSLRLNGADRVNELKTTIYALASDHNKNKESLGLSNSEIAKKLKKDSKDNNFPLWSSDAVHEADQAHYLVDVSDFIWKNSKKIKEKEMYLALINEAGKLDASDYPPENPVPNKERMFNYSEGWTDNRK